LIRETSDIVSGSIPLAVGFGISTPEHVRQIIQAGAEGAIVGSAFVKIVEENASNSSVATRKLVKFAQAMKKAARTRTTKRPAASGRKTRRMLHGAD